MAGRQSAVGEDHEAIAIIIFEAAVRNELMKNQNACLIRSVITTAPRGAVFIEYVFKHSENLLMKEELSD